MILKFVHPLWYIFTLHRAISRPGVDKLDVSLPTVNYVYQFPNLYRYIIVGHKVPHLLRNSFAYRQARVYVYAKIT